MISAVLIYGGDRGEVLASRIYKEGLKRAITDAFRVQVISARDNKGPLLTLGSTSFLHIRHNDMYLVAVTRHNVDAILVYELLYKLVDICTSYFGTFDENTCHKNVTLLYEILDELMDYGYPQNTEPAVLKQFLSSTPQPSAMSSVLSPLNRSRKTQIGSKTQLPASQTAAGATNQATGAVSWRREGVKYRRNEVFVDMVETFNLLADSQGEIISADVNGKINVKCHLSGMPNCRIGLNDSGGKEVDTQGDEFGGEASSAKIDDYHLHQCVDLSQFKRNRSIQFIPPDGEFELMRYHVTENVRTPFRISAQLERQDGGFTYNIQVQASFDSKAAATDVTLHIPVPPNTAKVNCNSSNGRARYESSANQVAWKIGRMTGSGKGNLAIKLDLSPSPQAWTQLPIKMQFSLSQYSGSGLKVRYLRVHDRSNYTALKWVRYLLTAGTYEVRV